MQLSAFALVQIAVAVFLGNLMAFAVVKGAQILGREDGPAWKYAAYAVPAAIGALVIIGSTG